MEPNPGDPPIRIDAESGRVDWVQAKADLAVDDFDNGRSPGALERSFRQSAHVAYAWAGDSLVGMARLLSDGVCNSYLVDVWTKSAYRRRGVGSALIRQLVAQVPGQHVGLQADQENVAFYESLGFWTQPYFMARVVGEWLANGANQPEAAEEP